MWDGRPRWFEGARWREPIARVSESSAQKQMFEVLSWSFSLEMHGSQMECSYLSNLFRLSEVELRQRIEQEMYQTSDPFVWKLLVSECPRYMFGCVNVTCSAQFSQETSTTPRRGAHSRLPQTSCSWERVNDMRAEFMFHAQVHICSGSNILQTWGASVYSMIFYNLSQKSIYIWNRCSMMFLPCYHSLARNPWFSELFFWWFFSSSLVLQDLKKELVGLEGLRDSLKPRYNGGVVVLSCRSR